MKAFALGGRGKWKDYVDLYFLLRDHFTLEEIILNTKTIFGSSFNALLFKKQLCFFEDIDYSETPIFLPGKEVDEATIKSFLTDVALS